ncbi:hypothetical protein HOD14_04665 [Candidatus Woesearchaeota archaeon]|nr:hypothetical protein [Candidatus Woesearchaeota archaeon]MBT4368641.1 hypothetical protein [Candidatus Woesearchaeota archaeon]MBT6638972.1 hypothetical protein [Candidatus Woesearchaeota archaeon]MBT7442090.1 hypothetical protein [Candidatus Woesearchaeota archaeon]
MKVAIIITNKKASQNIKEFLTELPSNMFLHEVDKDSIECENIDEEVEADLIVFATRHQSESRQASLTCHTQGNWGRAELGGKEGELGIAPALYLKEFYLELKKYSEEFEGDVTLEVTHHGPSVGNACMFVEIGSSEKEWTDKRYGKIIADCIKKVFVKKLSGKSCVLLGGGHYNSAANKIMERTEYAVGHICPKYALANLDSEMITQAIEKTIPKPSLVALDWKGLGQEKERIVNLLDEMNIKYKKSKSMW